MPFGLKNAPATFQRMVNQIVADIEGCEAYVDDLIVYSQTWEQHMEQLHQLFKKLSEVQLTVNLVIKIPFKRESQPQCRRGLVISFGQCERHF